MQRFFCLTAMLFFCAIGFSQLKVSTDKHYLVKSNGSPFFWLGDTAWELFHRLNREEAKLYLKDRAEKGFTVIQAVALAELDGINTPNVYGDKPLINNDPSTPNEAYFKHVDFIVYEAKKQGLLIALLPTWGDKWFQGKQGEEQGLFTPVNAKIYGAWIANRYINAPIVWVLGGDRIPKNENHFAIIRAMAEGIRQVSNGKQLITFHPSGGSSSFEFFPGDQWIDFDMSQTGHRVASPDYEMNIKAYVQPNIKPHINGEPNYEDHPNSFDPAGKGWMDDFDTREAAYWNMLSGGAGHTYGNHNIWQMFTEERKPISWARTNWKVALNHPGSFQVGYMRRMLEKRNWQRLVPDQTVLEGSNPVGVEYKIAAVSADGDFMMVYIPFGQKTMVNTSKIKSGKLRAWWFNPRDGKSLPLGEFENSGSREFAPNSVGRGSDWLLIIDDALKNYSNPKVS